MKICYLGNTCNNSFSTARVMEQLGHSVALFYCISGNDQQTFPEWEDPDAHQKYKWLHTFEANRYEIDSWKSPPQALLEKISQFDVIQAEDHMLIWAQQTGRPYGWWTFGYDIQHFPFVSSWICRHFLLERQPLCVSYIVGPIRYRRAMCGISFFNQPTWMAIRRKSYGLISRFLAPHRWYKNMLTFDEVLFSPRENTPSMQTLLNNIASNTVVDGLTIFHPTRIMFTNAVDFSYGSDMLLPILRKFVDIGYKLTFIIAQKGGIDEDRFKQLIDQYSLKDYFVWIPMLQRNEISNWYRACDIVTCQFADGDGSIGSLVLEALLCGSCVMSNVVRNSSEPSFFEPPFAADWPPLLPCANEAEAVSSLVKCATDKQFLAQKKHEGRLWGLRHCTAGATGLGTEQMYQEAITHPAKATLLTYSPPEPLLFKALSLQLKNNDIPSSLALLAQGLDENPENPALLRAMVELYRLIGGTALAKKLQKELEELEIQLP